MGNGPEHALTQGEIEVQIAAANALRAELVKSNSTLAASMLKLDIVAAQANALLQAYAKSLSDEKVAKRQAELAKTLSDQMQVQLAADRRTIGNWAYHAYAGGGGLADAVTLFDAMIRDASQVTSAAGDLAYLTDQRLRAFDRVRLSAADKKALADRATLASARATTATTATAEAKKALDGVMVQQKALVLSTRELWLSQVERAGPIAGILMGSDSARARAAAKALMEALKASGPLVTGIGKPCSTNQGDYPNGAIPASALCPLWGTIGQSLRPAAASAFNAMSQAYARDTGSPICVSDSYRTYAEQVALKIVKGKWAATPGTSEHGFGLAVDLCGGIEDFGTPAHLWMKQNAPLYGWYHPNWAEPTGSLPEPWHWEFAG